MATARSKKSGDSKPVEKKQVETPKVKEVKEAPKPVEKKVEPPKEEVSKVSPKKVEKPKGLQVGSLVLTPAGKECRVLEINEDVARLERVSNKKTLIVDKNIISLVGEK